MAAASWDIDRINAAGGGKVTWEDTRNQGSFRSYSRLTVPWGGYLYPAFDLNGRYEKTDVFVSLAKLKDHANAGVTMSVKNLFGIAPTSIYGDNYDGAGRRRSTNNASLREVIPFTRAVGIRLREHRKRSIRIPIATGVIECLA